MNGWFLSVIIEDNLFMLEFFKTFRIGLAGINDLSGKAMSVIIGIWKAETNITLAIRKKLEWHDVGQA
tara:strand:+ start:1814 stop:2017 length:204 start_codon:yes stop_codon:yes gene_type:complete